MPTFRLVFHLLFSKLFFRFGIAETREQGRKNAAIKELFSVGLSEKNSFQPPEARKNALSRRQTAGSGPTPWKTQFS